MIKSIPFKPGHLDLITLAKVHDDDPGICDAYDKGLVGASWVETIIDDSEKLVLGLMSAILVNDSCIEVCMVVSEDASHYPIQFAKHVKKSLEYYEAKLEVRRVQTTIRAGFPHLVKWMKLLGFKKESTMRKLGVQGDDYDMYVRFPNGV